MSGNNQSVTARDITGSSIVTGDHNIVSTTMKQMPLPPPDQVDVKAELAALREALAGLQKVPDRGKLDRAIEDAVEETDKSEPDKEEVGGALERAVKYAKAADDFGARVAVHSLRAGVPGHHPASRIQAKEGIIPVAGSVLFARVFVEDNHMTPWQHFVLGRVGQLAGLGKIEDPLADDLVHRQAQKLGCAGAGIHAAALPIGDQDRFGLV